jgi:hypothetical protein
MMKRHNRLLGSAGNILGQDSQGTNMTTYNCQILLNYILRLGKLYINNVSKLLYIHIHTHACNTLFKMRIFSIGKIIDHTEIAPLHH